MAERIFQELTRDNTVHQRHVCVGLDTDITRARPLLEQHLSSSVSDLSDITVVVQYNKMVIEATSDIAAAYKPNRAFYAKLGRDGVAALQETVEHAKQIAPHAVVILDAKYGDIDNTNDGYVAEAYDVVGADAVTLHNYMGHVAMAPFLDRKENGNFVLVRTSNKGGGEIQDIQLGPPTMPTHLYWEVARIISTAWNYNGNVGVVAGATFPEESKKIRDVVGHEIPILIPGVGAQGGTAPEITPLALRRGQRGVINSSRGIIFATMQEGETLPQAIRREAQKLHNEIFEAQNLAA